MKRELTLAEAVAEGQRRRATREAYEAQAAAEAAAVAAAQRAADQNRGRLLKLMQAWVRTQLMDLVAAAVGRGEANVMLDEVTYDLTSRPPLPLEEPAVIALLLAEGLVVEPVAGPALLGPAWRVTWPGAGR